MGWYFQSAGKKKKRWPIENSVLGKGRWNKTFPSKQKLKEFISSTSSKEMLEAVLQAEMKGH